MFTHAHSIMRGTCSPDRVLRQILMLNPFFPIIAYSTHKEDAFGVGN